MPKDLQVVKSNHIISASYRLSVIEQRIILCCIAQVCRDETITDEVLYSVRASDLAELCGTDMRRAYRDLAEAAERLYERRITILFEPDGKPRAARKRLTRWVQDVDYIEGEGRIELRFGKTILPFLTGLTEHFTRYQLSAVARMTSAHAIRLFELLAQYGSVGEREISLEQLQEWLQLEGNYSMFADLKRRVIEPAVAQVNEHSPLAVKWEQRKTGRKVTHLVFTFGPKKTTKAAAKGANTALTPAGMTDTEMAAYARPGETWEQLRARLRKAGTAA
ncbi:RepB family plasmid replication initiator protein [Azotobacter chroococcum]|uniref:Initiator Replication family protein n=1 Tax=Azotobacter chroococcum NCIMB 8003 TaxID=1328314 RepID=A0A0C4WWY3_9GAMM|nr:RepB family plasmid replication initiator protein [Azotobacter chroococcum]AJE23482.1 Initiator Replication family protein [Azotobacter chroococcum NCIMB 8003]